MKCIFCGTTNQEILHGTVCADRPGGGPHAVDVEDPDGMVVHIVQCFHCDMKLPLKSFDRGQTIDLTREPNTQLHGWSFSSTGAFCSQACRDGWGS